MGGIAGINAARAWAGQPLVTPPPTSALRCLIAHLTKSDPAHFQPMNTNSACFRLSPSRRVTRIEAASHPATSRRGFLTHGSRNPGFPDVLLVQDGASPQTVRAYASDLAQFQAFAGTVLNARGVLPLESVNSALIREFSPPEIARGQKPPWREKWPACAVFSLSGACRSSAGESGRGGARAETSQTTSPGSDEGCCRCSDGVS